eukprot:6923082-Heterocapsa_arctica.AAC.1
MSSSSSSCAHCLGWPLAAHSSPATDSVLASSAWMRWPLWSMKSELPKTVTRPSPGASSLPPSLSRKVLSA